MHSLIQWLDIEVTNPNPFKPSKEMVCSYNKRLAILGFPKRWHLQENVWVLEVAFYRDGIDITNGPIPGYYRDKLLDISKKRDQKRWALLQQYQPHTGNYLKFPKLLPCSVCRQLSEITYTKNSRVHLKPLNCVFFLNLIGFVSCDNQMI
jgi:hypothetical protein